MKALDLTNKRFGKLIVLSRVFDERKKKESLWQCKCDCGNIKIFVGWHLTGGKVQSCGCLKLKNDRTGHVYEYWTVLKYAGNEKWQCQCKCGTIKNVSTSSFYGNRSKSCGCIHSPNEKEYNERKKQKILKNITKTDNGCWEWNLYKNDRGYGNSSYRSYPMRINRLVWMLWKSVIPINMYVCHKCDNPKCCNPEHLFLGTHELNMKDMASKGRACQGEKSHLHKNNRKKNG